MISKDHFRGHDAGLGPEGMTIMAEMDWDACFGTDDVWEFAGMVKLEQPNGLRGSKSKVDLNKSPMSTAVFCSSV